MHGFSFGLHQPLTIQLTRSALNALDLPVAIVVTLACMTFLGISAFTRPPRLRQDAMQQAPPVAIVKQPTKALLRAVNQTVWHLTLGALSAPNMVAIALTPVRPANHAPIG